MVILGTENTPLHIFIIQLLIVGAKKSACEFDKLFWVDHILFSLNNCCHVRRNFGHKHPHHLQNCYIVIEEMQLLKIDMRPPPLEQTVYHSGFTRISTQNLAPELVLELAPDQVVL